MERKEAKKERENDCNSILGTTSIKECVTSMESLSLEEPIGGIVRLMCFLQLEN